jgi:uncharacterized protein YdeI (YjbR/CyaY-like superfamily)
MPKEEIFPVFFDSGDEFRLWLMENHHRASELWMGFYKKDSGRKGISYRDAVDEALCFGWIDGRVRGVNEYSYALRFSPRIKKSTWSAVNLKRIEELRAAGRLHPAGIKAHAERDPARAKLYSFEQDKLPQLTPEMEEEFKKNEDAWAFWQRQPASYRKAASWLMISAKKEETRKSRLAALILDSAAGRRYKPLRRPGD